MLDARNPSQKIYIRVNALDTGMTLGDLAAVMPGRPDGIVLPKCAGAAEVNRLSLYLDAFEAASDIEQGATRIVTVATETARAVLKLLDFENMSPRLWGMMWGAEDLAASLGASRNRTAGRFHGPFLLARDLCLISAAAAGVVAIDTVATDINDLDALREEAIAARQDGFLAKAVIHPKHVDVVNAAFMPTDEEIAWSEQIVKAFNDNPTSGVVKIDGKMIDKPHLRAAEKFWRCGGGKRRCDWAKARSSRRAHQFNSWNTDGGHEEPVIGRVLRATRWLCPPYKSGLMSAPSATSASTSPSEKPASRRTSPPCSPRRGGYCRIEGGVLLQVAAGPATRRVPSVGCSTDCNKPTAAMCGSSIRLSRSCSGACGMSASSKRRIHSAVVRVLMTLENQS